ncbi:MAG: hypothetical protein ACLT1X_03420 [Christensenellales bacterium]
MCDNHDVIVPLDRLMQLSQSNEATAQQLAGMVQQLGMYLVQLDTRLRRQEEMLQKRLTISSAQYRQMLAAIRCRASEIARKYQLDSAMLPLLRTAIRQDTISRWHVKDLHDLPESMLPEAIAGINTWDSYSTIRKLRQR